ncbi:MAG: hypothetical protein AAF391_01230, partial [Bacteroidota bacterium]
MSSVRGDATFNCPFLHISKLVSKVAHPMCQRFAFFASILFCQLFFFSIASAQSQSKLLPADPLGQDFFGQRVALSGNRALIATGATTRRVYYYELENEVWVSKGQVSSDSQVSFNAFGQGLALEGDRAMVGAPNGLEVVGSVYYFEFENGEWVQKQEISPNDGSNHDRFGHSVSISGDRAIIGSIEDDDSGNASGSAYIFEFQNGVWVQTDKFTGNDSILDDNFGRRVHLDGDRAIVGVRGHIDQGVNEGAAYVFELQGNEWIQTAKLLRDDGDLGGEFGENILLRGDRAVVSNMTDDDNGSSAGAVYVFDLIDGSWVQAPKVIPNDGGFAKRFGSSVFLADDKMYVGSRGGDNEFGISTGTVYIFDLVDGSWVESPERINANDGVESDLFGESIALDEDRILVGATQVADLGVNVGAAYVIELESTSTPTLSLEVSPSEPQSLGLGESLTYMLTVTDGGGNPVVGAEIIGEDNLTDTFFETDPTNALGETSYTTTTVREGEYTLTFHAIKDGFVNSEIFTSLVDVSSVSNSSIAGTIYDLELPDNSLLDNFPLTGAKIDLVTEGEILASVITDTTGSFAFSSLNEGATYFVNVVAETVVEETGELVEVRMNIEVPTFTEDLELFLPLTLSMQKKSLIHQLENLTINIPLLPPFHLGGNSYDESQVEELLESWIANTGVNSEGINEVLARLILTERFFLSMFDNAAIMAYETTESAYDVSRAYFLMEVITHQVGNSLININLIPEKIVNKVVAKVQETAVRILIERLEELVNERWGDEYGAVVGGALNAMNAEFAKVIDPSSDGAIISILEDLAREVIIPVGVKVILTQIYIPQTQNELDEMFNYAVNFTYDGDFVEAFTAVSTIRDLSNENTLLAEIESNKFQAIGNVSGTLGELALAAGAIPSLRLLAGVGTTLKLLSVGSYATAISHSGPQSITIREADVPIGLISGFFPTNQVTVSANTVHSDRDSFVVDAANLLSYNFNEKITVLDNYQENIARLLLVSSRTNNSLEENLVDFADSVEE